VSKKNDALTQMGQSMQQEIDGDAPTIAKELFGDGMPGTVPQNNSQMGDILQQAYQRGDRPFMLHLARQNPSGFLNAWKGIGGTVPGKGMTSGAPPIDATSNVNAP
jgi:hypothetical protein